MLKTVLETVSQQQQALLERAERIFTSAAEFVTNSLSTRYRSLRMIQTTGARPTYGSTDAKVSSPKTARRLIRSRGPASLSRSWMKHLTPDSPTTLCRKELQKCASTTASMLRKSCSDITS
ncbi:unnamed protein product [Toxocara canis]|uniref:Mediator of RNA polymerase II transcription subunit 11 n=1 Tax=Toxocara canis TaxID=6265 RepID=A0A183U7I8_TOXCA|nr:unnamed protein product [Toxocara canis]